MGNIGKVLALLRLHCNVGDKYVMCQFLKIPQRKINQGKCVLLYTMLCVQGWHLRKGNLRAMTWRGAQADRGRAGANVPD